VTNNIHPVVELLAARMESHPEEFPVQPNGQLPIMGRWAPWLAQAEHLMNDAERTLLYTKAKETIFQRIHEEVLDELMNGPERRAEEKRKRDEETQRHIAHAAAQQQAAMQQQLQGYRQAMGQYQSHLGAHSRAQATGIVGKSPSGIWVDEYAQLGNTTTQSTKLQLGSETIDEGMIKKIKKKLGI
jgi:hypothetical protein